MRRQAVAVTVIIILALAVFPAGGCGGGAGGAGTIKLQDLVEPAGFAIYFPVTTTTRPSLPAQTIDARLAGAAGLSPTATALLAQNGFVLTTGQAGELVDAYQPGEAPPFVTLDSLAYAFQSLCSYVQGGLEKQSLRRDLEGLTAAMLDASISFERAAGERGKVAARADQEFFGVAARLLDPAAELPAGVEGTVAREVRFIEAGVGSGESPVFGYEEDYGTYVPRGHYALDEEAASYFRAMTWYQRMGMRLRPAGGTQMRQAGRDETRQAILLVGGLHQARVGEESALGVWERLFQVNRFFGVGWEGFDVYDYTRLMEAVYGREFPVSRLESDEALDGFIDQALESYRLGASSLGTGGAPEDKVIFSFLSRDTTPDDYILEQLSDPSVKERYLPRGLDVTAVLGSARAREINLTLYDDSRFPGYDARVEALRRAFITLSTQVTAGSVYWNQLYSLKQTLSEPGPGFPAFMSNQGWVDRSLYSFLGSWTALRCDAAVPGGQAGSPAAPAAAPTAAFPGYVEPNPEALGRMAAIVDVARRGLAERGLMTNDASVRLDAMHSLLMSLKGMAEKELQNQPFTAEEQQVLQEFGERLRYAGKLSAPPAGTGGSGLACITGVREDPAGMEVLEEAVGYPATYHVIVPYQGGLYYTRGAGFSYYEFRQPLDDPLTSSAWRAMLEAGSAPLPPAWTATFLVY